VESSALFDQDGTPIRAVDAVYREETDSYQQEILLNGSSGRLDWTVGAVYFKDEASVPPVTIIAGPLVALGWRIDRHAEQDLESIAGFAQGTYRLTDQTRLTLGARYTRDKRSIEGRDDVVIATLQGPVTGRPTVPPGFPLVVSLTEVRQSVDFDEPTWRVALDHDLGDDTMIYVSYSRGYKTGQYNVISYANPAVKPEVLDAYEAGIKADMLNNTLRFNAALFHYDYKNIQLLSVQTGGAAIVNAAESRIRGLDLEASWIPSSALQFTGALSILDGEYTDYPNAEGFVPNPAGGNIRIANFDATGNDTVNTPDWTLTLTGSYSVPLSTGSLTFDLTYLHSDDVTYTVDGADVQDAYDVVNARAGFKSMDERWGIALYARNLTDEQYLASVSRSTLGDLMTLSPPRTYGVELSYRWE
jgi:iron complex outermembrane receptor protein